MKKIAVHFKQIFTENAVTVETVFRSALRSFTKKTLKVCMHTLLHFSYFNL